MYPVVAPSVVGTIIMLVILAYFVWFLFLTDRNLQLAFYEWFGKGLSIYGREGGSVVWITGACDGLGQALALDLAKQRAKIVLSDGDEASLQRIKQECIVVSNGTMTEADLLVLPFNLMDASQDHVDEVVSKYGRIDVLFGALGPLGLGRIDQSSTEVEVELMTECFFGFVALIKFAILRFRTQGHGQICVLSSVAGKYGIPGQAAYCAAEHALQAYFSSIRTEFNDHDIQVTLVSLDSFEREVPGRKIILTESNRVISFRNVGREGLFFSLGAWKMERMSRLVLVAVANRLFQCYVCKQPALLAISAHQYFPDLARKFSSWAYSKQPVG